mgnify:CR=1 FL=1
MRLTVAFGISSLAVWVLGPLVKGIGFSELLWAMAGIAALKAAIVLLLPDGLTGLFRRKAKGAEAADA